jgi:hypothetical protein
LERLETINAASRIEVLSLSTVPGESIIAQVQLWPKDKAKRVERAMVNISADGSTQELTRTDPRLPVRVLMGTTADQKTVYRSARDGKMSLSFE